MRVEMVTREDLELFRLELVRDLREILQSSQQQSNNEWLKNTEVMKLLKVFARMSPSL